MGKQVNELIEKLQQSLEQTVVVLSALSDAELDELSPHPCAMGGTICGKCNSRGWIVLSPIPCAPAWI